MTMLLSKADFLRTWGVDIRSMLVKPPGDRESGAQRGKEAD